MLAIRILNGPQAGQIYRLKEGKNKFGRGTLVDFQLQSTGISKEHFEITVSNNQIFINDLASSNGTFLNGVRINKSILRTGDKISAYDILLDIMLLEPSPVQQQHYYQPSETRNLENIESSGDSRNFGNSGNLGYKIQELQNKFNTYMETVALPAIYRLPVVFEFRNIIYGFAAIFVIMVTLLSIIPMKFITSESISAESKRRALTIARTLASANSRIIKDGRYSEYNSELIIKEEGLDEVFILAKDGTILAPPERFGGTPQKEVAFIKKLRSQSKEFAAELTSGRVAAGAPIVSYNAELGENVTNAYAVVIFDSNSLAFDDGRALSLFIQMLILASICGLIIFFFMYKIIERPFSLLKSELDLALREGRDQAHIDIRFPVIQEILISVNSLLSRALHKDSAKPMGSSINKEHELANILSIIGLPALLFNKDAIALGVNPSFEQLTGISVARVLNQNLKFIPDQALQKNIQLLLETAKNNPSQTAQDKLEINGHHATLQCQAISGSTNEIEYFIITFSPTEEVHGGAA